jgi:hypothetical protein
MELAYGRETSLVDMLGLRVGEVDRIRMGNGPNLRFNRILQNAWSYAPLNQYAFYSYTKPELMLRTLESLLGETTMARIMRTFQERWRFRHPCSDDFFAVASEVAGRDLRGYFDATVRGTDILDYEIGAISSEKVKPSYGVFERDGKMVAVTKKEAEKQVKEGAIQYESVILVRRRGEVIVPVEIELKFEGKPPERQHWDGNDRTITYRITRPEKLEWANVDPERGLVLDVDWLNNSRRIEDDGRVAFKYAAKWMFWIQNVLALIGI